MTTSVDPSARFVGISHGGATTKLPALMARSPCWERAAQSSSSTSSSEILNAGCQRRSAAAAESRSRELAKKTRQSRMAGGGSGAAGQVGSHRPVGGSGNSARSWMAIGENSSSVPDRRSGSARSMPALSIRSAGQTLGSAKDVFDLVEETAIVRLSRGRLELLRG